MAAPLRSTQPVPKDLRPLLSEAGDTEAEDDEASMDSGAEDSYGSSGKFGNVICPKTGLATQP